MAACWNIRDTLPTLSKNSSANVTRGLRPPLPPAQGPRPPRFLTACRCNHADAGREFDPGTPHGANRCFKPWTSPLSPCRGKEQLTDYLSLASPASGAPMLGAAAGLMDSTSSV